MATKEKKTSAESAVLEVNPDVFMAKHRKRAAAALSLRARGKARIRYATKPTRKDGNPFVAVRVPAELRDAFKKLATKKKTTAANMLRAYMSRVTGVKVEAEEGNE